MKKKEKDKLSESDPEGEGRDDHLIIKKRQVDSQVVSSGNKSCPVVYSVRSVDEEEQATVKHIYLYGRAYGKLIQSHQYSDAIHYSAKKEASILYAVSQSVRP